MKASLVSLLACAALCACATETSQVAEGTCEQGEPALGSLVVRRDRCVVSNEESRKRAREQADAMREQQDRRRTLERGPKGG
jgi:hypothetical protein